MDQELRERTATFTESFEEKYADLVLDLGAAVLNMTEEELGELIKAIALVLACKRELLKQQAAAAWQ